MGSVRTDLAIEAHESLGRPEIPGVHVEEERGAADIAITRVRVAGEEGSRRLGKPPGRYVTVESKNLRRHDPEHARKVGEAVSHEIAAFLDEGERAILVVGLGNWNATPDALGPRVVGQVLVTRHLQRLLGEATDEGFRTVSALAPGVLGLTGIETSEIVQGVVDRTRPDVVAAVDSLAASNIERIGTTVQISDTGIHPGSGIGTGRGGLTRETLGTRVLAVGVPTVVHAMTLARNAVQGVKSRLGQTQGASERLEELSDDPGLLKELLGDSFGSLVVTPKEIDVMIRDLSHIVAGALNTAFHRDVDLGEFALYA